MEEDTAQDPRLELAQKLFLLRASDVAVEEKEEIQRHLIAAIDKDYLLNLYKSCVTEFGWPLDDKRVATLQETIDEEVKKLDERITDAQENLGESEVREALLAKALFYVRILDKEKALEQLKVTETKTVAVGQKMDLVFHSLKLGFVDLDFDLISQNIAKAKSLFDEGGDWERKNRLKVYEGLLMLATRQFKKAADLFLDAIATFTTYELFSYNTFIFYAVLTSVISLDRVKLKEKVVDAPEILSVIDQIPSLDKFLNALYDCDYKLFLVAFAALSDSIRKDRYLHPHFRFVMREIRVGAYAQFLEAYKSVTIEAMAAAFGVGVEFLDRELSMFIASGRLKCKIDKVAGILETNRADSRNALYQQTIRQGDLLLNRVQRLSRVIDV
eukprot:TRINITY_DN26925_c0_g1_i1.p1 TRINITY_DN26925_c0_g1~~TRINITY_DN26925_c0_g1_i1.p1  ORF type:complete len:386 (-),score=102.10 TRINITY_DN26925_c0_g1_i1:286-1443(-)